MTFHETIIKYIVSFLLSVLSFFIVESGVFLPLANSLNDYLYQVPSTPDSRIVIIGIDQRALSEFGEFPWDRDIIANAIAYLNKDEETMPCVIGIDVLFVNESENDELLLNVSSEHDNIVYSSYAEFSNKTVSLSESEFYIDDFYVSSFSPVFEALDKTSLSGHVNAMIDSDGVLRHGLWQIDLENGETVPSFHSVIANLYADKNDLPPIEPPPMDSNNMWYISQQSSPGAYSDGISVLDLVNQSIDSSYFDDKIVLIGPYAAGLQDDFKTPIDSSEKMYGVEYQANAISALLNGETKYIVPNFYQSLLLSVIVFFSSVFFSKKKTLIITIFWILLFISWIIMSISLYNIGILIYTLYVPMFISILYLISIISNYSVVFAEKLKLSRTFERYVAPEIVKELLKGGKKSLELGGKVVDVSVMFADIRGFTALSSVLPPKTSVEIVNKYLSLFSQSILKHNGTLDKYIGDCTMAFWGAPLKDPESAFKAIKTASEIIEKSTLISAEIKEKYGFDINVGIGITLGPAVVGNIGSSVRMDYTAIGDCVNTASRLENAASGGEIYVNKEIVTNLTLIAEFSKVSKNIKLKGKEDDFEIFKFERFI